jgi:hypothetical protein
VLGLTLRRRSQDGPDLEPPIGIEPMTYALREARHADLGALPAQIAALVARNAPNAQGAWDCRSTIRSTAWVAFR